MSAKARFVQFDRAWLQAGAVCLVLYVTAVAFRPALPIDETRYLSVAWEMWLRQDWLAPLTVNFEPYHHKPPLLFWLINSFWTVFGVNRWSATIAPTLSAFGVVMLASALTRRLAPELEAQARLILLGSMVFLLFATLIMFDLTLTVFVLGALLSLLAYARERRARYVFATGLMLGIGVLTKGPVAYLYVAFPILLGPWWLEEPRRLRSWYLGNLAALLISLLPIALWLVPVLKASSSEFGYWLVWEQTAGRVTGSYEASHARPFYFYLLVLPVLLLPWVLRADFWRHLGVIRERFDSTRGIRFVVIQVLPTIGAFSLIAGKQIHYLLPLLPGMAILVAVTLQELPLRSLGRTVVIMVALVVAFHAVAAVSFIDRYDLRPLARYIADHRQAPIAFVGGNYRGEFTFLARLQKKVDTPGFEQLYDWYSAHPDGIAIVRYLPDERPAGYELVMSQPYRGKIIGIFAAGEQ